MRKGISSFTTTNFKDCGIFRYRVFLNYIKDDGCRDITRPGMTFFVDNFISLILSFIRKCCHVLNIAISKQVKKW